MTAWTKGPPKEPGWYWTRVVIQSQSWIGPPKPREWAPGDWTIDGERLREFWPIPIQPPTEETP